MKKIVLIVISILIVACNNTVQPVVTATTIGVAMTPTVSATMATATAMTPATIPVFPPENQGWISDPYGNQFFKGDCYSHGSEYSQGLTDFCQGKTLKIWSVWPGWYIAYERIGGETIKISLIQGENTITFPADAWMIRIGR